MYSPSSKFWVCPGGSSQLVMPRRGPNKMPELLQLAPLEAKEQHPYSELPEDDQTPHPI